MLAEMLMQWLSRVTAGGGEPVTGRTQFYSQGPGYDYATAIRAGMGPDGTGENAGHWGSVAPAPPNLGLPADSYVMLKGRRHPTWGLGVEGERERGSDVIKKGTRYYSVPRSSNGR